ncbi:hypothetical protein VTK73DRAFT_8943 [Phialemonium thermophilum]|uniref:Mitochondrial inner-membrane-bound regulator-domain-containing protein n=1 Tax=Phialemonium thermophilum TaxID=223376 RepID=A0ABR3Y620_9PEZI
MISRKSAVGFVCLHCRLSRAVFVGSRSWLLWNSVQQRRNHDAAAIHGAGQEQRFEAAENTGNFTEKQSDASDPIQAQGSQGEEGRTDHNPVPTAPRKATSRGRRSRPTPEVYYTRGHKVRPREEKVPIDILGKPAHAIVMNDLGKLQKRRPVVQDTDDQRPNVNLSHVLEQQQSVLTPDDVFRNIEELRPNGTRALTQREFDSLKDTLMHGFTKAQLDAYMAQHELQAGKDPADSSQNAAAPWIVEKWDWVPETGASTQTGDRVLEGYVHRLMSPKEQLAVRLIRKCWFVSAVEVENRLGHIDVRLRSLEFELLMLGNGKILGDVSRSLLEPGKRIELIPSEKIIRIIASKVTAEVILGEINSLLSRLETREFNTTVFSPRCLAPSSLHELGRITNTVIRIDGEQHKISVHWVPPRDHDYRLEDLGDVVFRLLLSASRPPHQPESQVKVIPAEDSEGGRYVVDFYNAGKWSWKDRIEQWARWIMPIPSQAARPRAEEGFPETLSVKLWPPLFDGTVEPADQRGAEPTLLWPSRVQRSTTAIFGHVLYPYPAKHPNRLDRTQPSIMSPILPPFSTLALAKPIPGPKTNSTTILMRFIPDPTQHSCYLESAPPLELRLEASDSEILGISSLRAILSSHTHDILMPRKPVDVRLQQTQFLELPGSSMAAEPSLVAPLVSFLEAADLRPSDARLVTPSRLRGVPLPCNPNADVPDRQAVIDYLFMGLEVRRTVSADYNGWRVVFTNIEAGQGGGRRGELTLEAEPAQGRTEEVGAVELNQERKGASDVFDNSVFLATVSELAFGEELWCADSAKKG